MSCSYKNNIQELLDKNPGTAVTYKYDFSKQNSSDTSPSII